MLFGEIKRRWLVLGLRDGTVERFRALLAKLQYALRIRIFEEVLDSWIFSECRRMKRVSANLALFLVEVGGLTDPLLRVPRLGQYAQHMHPVFRRAKLVGVAPVSHDLWM